MNLEALTGREIEQKAGTLISNLSEIQRRYSETIESTRNQGHSAFTFRYPKTFFSSDLTNVIKPGQGLLYFLIVDGEVWSLLVLENLQMNLRHHSLSAKDANSKIERLRSLDQFNFSDPVIEASESAARDRTAKELYDLLLRPREAALASLSRLLIVPDGPLHLLPWGSLIRDDTQSSDAGPHYLTGWKSIHLVLSGTVYAELQKSRHRPEEVNAALSLVAFADPKYSVEGPEEKSEGMADRRSRSTVRPHRFNWQPLLFSRQEVEGIARLFPSDRTKVYLGEEATEEHAKTIGDVAQIIHFATHAHLDDRFPLNSALVLSTPESLVGDRENGLLQVWEIFERVRWHADLVVLSACETALGEEQGGEGLLGLTRAFQYAGARSVLASLWSVNDQATSELMIRFYKHLLAGLPKDQALQAAQQELIRGPIEVTNDKGERVLKDFSAPYYWAGFQLYGDWQ